MPEIRSLSARSAASAAYRWYPRPAMQILIIARDYKPLTGGIAEYTHQLAHQLHAAGDSVTVLAQIRPASAAQDAACGYAVERVDFSQLGERGPLALLQRLQLLQRAVQRLQPEIVICNVLGREAQAVRLVCRRHALPYVIFAYGREITRLRLLVEQGEAARYTRAMNAVLRDAARVVAISSYTHEQLLALNVAPAAIHLVRPGIDTAGRIPPGTLARLNLPPAWERAGHAGHPHAGAAGRTQGDRYGGGGIAPGAASISHAALRDCRRRSAGGAVGGASACRWAWTSMWS